jgi:hypothetical protein
MTNGTVTIGVVKYPARQAENGTLERNTKKDGTGKWTKVLSPKNIETFEPDVQEDLQNATGAKAQRPVIMVGAKFYRVRSNGTKRHVPTLAGEDLALAETVRGKRSAGATMRQLSEEMHLSVSTLRRLLGSLALTEQAHATHAEAK